MAGELTYRRLLNYLKILEADESPMLDLDVTVKIDDEFRSIAHIMVTHEDDVLDKDHPYFIIGDEPHSEGWTEEDEYRFLQVAGRPRSCS